MIAEDILQKVNVGEVSGIVKELSARHEGYLLLSYFCLFSAILPITPAVWVVFEYIVLIKLRFED